MELNEKRDERKIVGLFIPKMRLGGGVYFYPTRNSF
jgi:hypothetical protein